jgi:hypothetical protein
VTTNAPAMTPNAMRANLVADTEIHLSWYSGSR